MRSEIEKAKTPIKMPEFPAGASFVNRKSSA